MLTCLVRRTYAAAALFAQHPPEVRHPYKRLVLEMALPPGASLAGELEVTRWAAAALPEACTLAPTVCTPVPGHFAYGDDRAVWHVNFADPDLFYAYGSSLLAQDELQAAEHPVLGSIREALLVEEHAATERDGQATPVLVVGAERRCEIMTAPCAARPGGLYGNRFAQAPIDEVRAAIRVITPPTRTNLIAIAAPAGGRGAYRREELAQVLVTAYTGFAAAALESRGRWPGAPVEIRTGFWGCGAFGGNRRAMTVLQLLAARLAGIDQLRFYVFDEAGRAIYEAGAADLDEVLAPGGSLADVIARIEARGYQWGVRDGN